MSCVEQCSPGLSRTVHYLLFDQVSVCVCVPMRSCVCVGGDLLHCTFSHSSCDGQSS